RAGNAIARIVRLPSARGIDRLVVPLVHDHRKHQIVTRIGKEPVLVRLGPVLEVANSSQNCAGICNHTPARLEHNLEIIEERFRTGLPSRGPNYLHRASQYVGWTKMGTEHDTLRLPDFTSLRPVAEIVDRYPTSDIDVGQPVASLAVEPQQVLPHCGKGFGVWIDVWCLGADVNMNSCKLDQLWPF